MSDEETPLLPVDGGSDVGETTINQQQKPMQSWGKLALFAGLLITIGLVAFVSQGNDRLPINKYLQLSANVKSSAKDISTDRIKMAKGLQLPYGKQ